MLPLHTFVQCPNMRYLKNLLNDIYSLRPQTNYPGHLLLLLCFWGFCINLLPLNIKQQSILLEALATLTNDISFRNILLMIGRCCCCYSNGIKKLDPKLRPLLHPNHVEQKSRCHRVCACTTKQSSADHASKINR